MYESSSDEAWQYIKGKIESLELADPQWYYSFFCGSGTSHNLNKLLISDLKDFVKLIDGQAEIKAIDKYTIIIGALFYFHSQHTDFYQNFGLAGIMSSNFASIIAPFLEDCEKIKKSALKHFRQFMTDNQGDILERKDDYLSYLFSKGTTLSDIEKKVAELKGGAEQSDEQSEWWLSNWFS